MNTLLSIILEVLMYKLPCLTTEMVGYPWETRLGEFPRRAGDSGLRVSLQDCRHSQRRQGGTAEEHQRDKKGRETATATVQGWSPSGSDRRCYECSAAAGEGACAWKHTAVESAEEDRGTAGSRQDEFSLQLAFRSVSSVAAYRIHQPVQEALGS